MTFEGREFDLSRPKPIARLRGAGISMIFQDPMSAPDPLMTVRRHLALRTSSDPVDLLRIAGFDDPGRVIDSFPHQMSGGQCQRVAIACALARRPRLLVADEPTTALDVTVQAGILDRLRKIAESQGMAIIFVTHDLAVAYQLCNQIIVMKDGMVVETGRAEAVLTSPQAEYTRRLIASIPNARHKRHGNRTSVAGEKCLPVAAPVLKLRNISVDYKRSNGVGLKAVCNASIEVHAGEILGLVGESGSGKSTLAKTAVGLATPSSGSVELNGEIIDWTKPRLSWRKDIQYIFQDPRGALDPLGRILKQVRQPLDIHRIGDSGSRSQAARARLVETHLDESLHLRKPGSLSGGQRQRATIARALTVTPRVLICDESVSALDVSIQARILELLLDLRDRHGLAILFISHDLSVIQHICDRVVVMKQGEIVEEGETTALFQHPRQPYTRNLIAALPQLPTSISDANSEDCL
jgi:peptide/nickel transport system ATP-binding protein